MNPGAPQNLEAWHIRVDTDVNIATAVKRIVGAVVLVAPEGELIRIQIRRKSQ